MSANSRLVIALERLKFEIPRVQLQQDALSSTTQQSLADCPSFLQHLAINCRRVELHLYNKEGA